MVNPASSRALRVCIATPDIVGPVRNGGIGTAYTALAQALQQAGHDVTVLYLLGEYSLHGPVSRWVRHYADQGIRLVPMQLGTDLPAIDPTWWSRRAYEVYLWFRRHGQHFDLVHTPEWKGLAHYVLQAKRQGLGFAATRFVVGLHSPTLWHRAGGNEPITRLDDLELDFLERSTVANADAVVSPSHYLLDWVREQGWALPADARVLQNLLPASVTGADVAQAVMPRELVFFGRLETRKGLELFCAALDRLSAAGAMADREVTFVGKPGLIAGQPADAYLKARAAGWPFRWRLRADFDQRQALDYLRQPGRLAVIPSLAENSPYTVLECLAAGVPFLASAVGGIPELIAAADQARVCFQPRPDALARTLRAALAQPCQAASPACPLADTRQRWLAWHAELSAAVAHAVAAAPAQPLPRVSVCLVHYNRPQMLAQALDSLRAQDYPDFEVILVDDGSQQPAALAYLDSLVGEFDRRGWRIIRQDNRYLGAARNTAAAAASGAYLLFMDDDNIAKPHELSTFVRAALHSDADILTCVMDVFTGAAAPAPDARAARLWLPLGGAAAVGVYRNCFGDANALVRRAAFERLGGFTEDYGTGHEDWEFFATAVLRGLRLQVVPEPLFCYRVQTAGMLNATSRQANHLRSLRPYLAALPAPLAGALALAHGALVHAEGAAGGTVPGPRAHRRLLWRGLWLWLRQDAKLSRLRQFLCVQRAAGWREAMGAVVRFAGQRHPH